MSSIPTADVVVARVRLTRFRCLDSLDIELDRSTTYLVGENNSGKSSVLLGIETALGRRRPTLDDLQRDEDGTVSADAHIDVFLQPRGANSFDDELGWKLQNIQQDPGTETETVGIRTILRSSEESHFLITDRRFLHLESADWEETPSPAADPRVLQAVDAQLLHASRDLVAELGDRTSNWERILINLGIPDELGDGQTGQHTRDELELALAELAADLRRSSAVLHQLELDLKGLMEAQSTIGRVELQPLPQRLDEIASTVQLVLKPTGTPPLPMRFHGMGSRSLAALLVFKTLCSVGVGADLGSRPHMLTMLEEPEAHLHPQAIVALRHLIEDLPGQCIVSTHSPQLVSEVDPCTVRLLRQEDGRIHARSLPPVTAKKVAQFRRFVERPLGEVFFSRLVLFGDGTTERNTLPVLLRPCLPSHPRWLGNHLRRYRGNESV